MILSEEQTAAVWLSYAEVSPGRVNEFRNTYHSLAETWEAFGKENGPQFRGGCTEILNHLHSKDAMEQVIQRLQDCHVHLLFQEDIAYPQILLNIPQAPYLLYYAGNIESLKSPMISIVGTRHPSKYGIEVAAQLAGELAKKGICIVSGLARGIDAAAHQAVVKCEGQTIGILGSGLNVPYPKEHVQLLRSIAGGHGLIMTEYPLDASPVAYHFPHRNRIISGLCLGVVFVEGRIKSGGMNTVGLALNQGREVFAVPGRIGTECSEGPLAIMREGARIVTCADDILEDLGLNNVSQKESIIEQTELFSDTRKKIVKLMKNGPVTVEEIVYSSGLSADDILMELSLMEIESLVVREDANQYSLPLSEK